MPIYGKKVIIKNTFFFRTKNCSNDDLFISCNGRIGKNVAEHLLICYGYFTQVSEPWPVDLLFLIFPENRLCHLMQTFKTHFLGKKEKCFKMMTAGNFTSMLSIKKIYETYIVVLVRISSVPQ